MYYVVLQKKIKKKLKNYMKSNRDENVVFDLNS